jgi:hypothetical protein
MSAEIDIGLNSPAYVSQGTLICAADPCVVVNVNNFLFSYYGTQQH